jgi:VCBS repeat-containing protein
VTVTITGTNDAAVISGDISEAAAETDAALTLGGTLTASDVDNQDNSFIAQTGVAGSHGTFSITADGAWTFEASSAFNELNVGDSVTDTFTVQAIDGTAQVVTVTITGTNDAAVISGDISEAAAETDAALTLGGTLTASDVDNQDNSFIAQTGVAGSHGTFSITADGAWTFEASSAFNELNVGDSVTDTFTVQSVDGTAQVVTVTITGTNDAAVISGDISQTAAETDAALTLSGTLSATDVDNVDNSFTAQTNVAGTYGTFSITADGAWTFEASSAFNELNVGDSVTDTFTVQSVDGTAQVVTVTITGTNDAAVISGDVSQTVAESDAVLTLTGTLTATDLDNTDNSFTAQTNVAGSYGTFSIAANGQWTFEANSAFNELNVGDSYVDTFTVQSVDGTEQIVTVTITGTNDAAVISGDISQTAAETDAPMTLTGTLTATDLDNADNSFTAQANVAGTYGTFSIAANGQWTFEASSAFNELNVGDSYVDTFTVQSVDGTAQVVTVTITGTNDAAVISGDISQTVAESDAPLNMTGTLTVTDLDNTDNSFIAQTGVAGSHGTFSITADGAWTFEANSAFNELNVGDSVTDTFTVQSIDGTEQVVTVTITGTNDAAVISGDVSQTVAESDAVLTLTGTLTATDLDNTDNSFTAQTNVAGSYGTFSIAANGQWTFEANSAFNELNVGDSYVDTFTVQSVDGTAQVVTVTMTGTNDAPVANSDSQNTEENTLLNSRVPPAIDLDGTIASYALVSDVGAGKGSLSFSEDGSFSFNPGTDFDYLAVDESKVVTFTYTATDNDGTVSLPATVTIIVTGSYDAPILSGVFNGNVYKNANLFCKGNLTITGVDFSSSLLAFPDVPPTFSSQGYGLFTLSEGTWTYQLNNNHPSVKALKSGEILFDTHNFVATDGSTQVVSIVIHGVDDNHTQPWDPLYEANEVPQNVSGEVNSTIDSNEHIDNQVLISSTSDADLGQQPEIITDLNAYVDRLINELNSVDHFLDNPVDVIPVDNEHSQSQRQGAGRFAHRITNIKHAEQSTAFSNDLDLTSEHDYLIDSDSILSETEEKAFWDRLDQIRQQMDDPDAVDDAKPVNVQIMLGTGVSLTAGFVSWILRGGSLLASFMSTVPLLKRFDPLPVLKSSAKKVQINENDEADDDSFESEIDEELEVERINDRESK